AAVKTIPGLSDEIRGKERASSYGWRASKSRKPWKRKYDPARSSCRDTTPPGENDNHRAGTGEKDHGT
ncbi:hypothetical protein A2U01_0085045, partial [Trifolium medium]|nr:hypothetical protein [Trifolium medium]